MTACALAEQLQRTEVIALNFSAATVDRADQTATVASDPATSGAPEHTASAAPTVTTPHTATGRPSGLEESRQLKAELKARGLSTKGSKAELRARLAGSENVL